MGGGVGLASAADFAIATPTASFALSEVTCFNRVQWVKIVMGVIRSRLD